MLRFACLMRAIKHHHRHWKWHTISEFHGLNAPNQNGDLHNCIENEWGRPVVSVVSAPLRIECRKVHRSLQTSSSIAHPECNYKIVWAPHRRWRSVSRVKTQPTQEIIRWWNYSENRPTSATDHWCRGYLMPLNYGTGHERWYCGVRGNRPIIWKCNELFIFMNDWVEWLSDCQSNRIWQHFDCTGVGCFGNIFIASLSQHSTANCRCLPTADEPRNQHKSRKYPDIEIGNINVVQNAMRPQLNR